MHKQGEEQGKGISRFPTECKGPGVGWDGSGGGEHARRAQRGA